MRYLIFFILLFLLIRLISYAYFNRPSVSGTRKSRKQARSEKSGSGRTSQKTFGDVEEADFEEIEEPRKEERS